MNSIKNSFSIKDLENLSGIKAHTIRIWEKRYGLLSPERTKTNIRFYSLASLQNLLNITLLYKNGIKISKISALNPEQILEECDAIATKTANRNLVNNNLKIAMLNFDAPMFEATYQKLLKGKNFGKVFVSYFVPLLKEIGFLWQTDSIMPAHEHFITALIKQKILIHIEKEQHKPIRQRETYILFLPESEIHDLGLLYLSYELLKSGYKVIYLGQSLPIKSLELFLNSDHKTTFVSYCTVAPSSEAIQNYVEELHDRIISNCHSELWLLGNKVLELDASKLPDTTKIFTSVSDVIHSMIIEKSLQL
jgi:DNA-binding transcriptional MerR regulator